MQRSLVIGSQGLQDVENLGENLIINGEMHCAQRGTVFNNISPGSYSIDRWAYGGTVNNFNVSRSTDAPTLAQAGTLTLNSLLISCATARASLAAADLACIYQNLEGYHFQNIAQKPFVLSFWAKASVTGRYCVSFRGAGNTKSYVAEYTINAANTWERKSITVAASPSAGTWNYTNGTGLCVSWSLGCGSTFKTPANSWADGNFFDTTNQVNLASAVGNTLQIALVQIEPGIIVNPFHKRSIQSEFNLCYRYYYRGLLTLYGNATVANYSIGNSWNLPVVMRATPTSRLISTSARTNISSTNTPAATPGNGREIYFRITSAAAGEFWAVNDTWEFDSEL